MPVFNPQEKENSFDALEPLCYSFISDAGWSSSVARRAHNPKVIGSNPVPATKFESRVDSEFLLAIMHGSFAEQATIFKNELDNR